ncbi:MAG: hypothetical protein ACK5MV_00245 [Aminipila sp.]
MNKQLQKIAEHYGIDNQLGKLEEETKELAEAAVDYRENPIPQTLEHLMEEIADVENVISQIKYLISKNRFMPIRKTIDRYRESKIERQLLRIESEAKHE